MARAKKAAPAATAPADPTAADANLPPTAQALDADAAALAAENAAAAIAAGEEMPAEPKMPRRRRRIVAVPGHLADGDPVRLLVNGRLLTLTVGARADIPAEYDGAIADAGLTTKED